MRLYCFAERYNFKTEQGEYPLVHGVNVVPDKAIEYESIEGMVCAPSLAPVVLSVSGIEVNTGAISVSGVTLKERSQIIGNCINGCRIGFRRGATPVMDCYGFLADNVRLSTANYTTTNILGVSPIVQLAVNRQGNTGTLLIFVDKTFVLDATVIQIIIS